MMARDDRLFIDCTTLKALNTSATYNSKLDVELFLQFHTKSVVSHSNIAAVLYMNTLCLGSHKSPVVSFSRITKSALVERTLISYGTTDFYWARFITTPHSLSQVRIQVSVPSPTSLQRKEDS